MVLDLVGKQGARVLADAHIAAGDITGSSGDILDVVGFQIDRRLVDFSPLSENRCREGEC